MRRNSLRLLSVTLGLFLIMSVIYPLQPLKAEAAEKAILEGGTFHTLALKDDGTVWAWGYNSYGQLGDGTTTSHKALLQVKGLMSAVSIAAGGYSSAALKGDGMVWTWGQNSSGQIGDGTTTTRKIPVQVTGLSGVSAIAAGAKHMVALKSDGTVWAWGYNGYGQLGDGTTTTRKTPVQVSGLLNVIEIVAGANYTVALKSDGTLWAWGNNGYGQLGDGTATTRKTPVQVIGLVGVTAIKAGDNHNIAIGINGTVWTWGQNSSGQLGDGTTTTRKTPTQITVLSGITAVTAGAKHSLALKGDGTIWAWGYNYYGQLGDGTATNRKTPVQITGLMGATAIGAGSNHSISLKNDDSVWAWGYNKYGQLGDGTVSTRKTPTQVLGIRIQNPNTSIDVPVVELQVDQDLLNAQNAVDDAETLAGGELNTQVLIDAAQQAHDQAMALVNQLPDGDDKTDLLDRLTIVQQLLASKSNIDITAPITDCSTSTSPNANGWNNKDVQVTLTATDNAGGSGVAITEYSFDGTTWNTYSSLITITDEGETNVYYRSTDKAGNVESAKTINIKIDKTAPTISGTPTTLPNENDWYTSDVSIHFIASDTLSGIDTVTPDTTVSTDGANQNVTGNAIDKAGNTASITVPDIKIDKTAPATNLTTSISPNANDWYNKDVQVTLTATDKEGGSGVAKTEYSFDGTSWNTFTSPLTINSEGVKTIFYRSTDKAGNQESVKTVSIKIDKTPPTISGATITSPNGKGWYNSDVVVHFTASDSLSGVDTVTPDTTISTEGASQSINGTVMDQASNSAIYIVSGINIDKSAPQELISAPVDGGEYFLNQEVISNWSATDSISGIASVTGTTPSGSAIDTTVSGAKTYTVEALDNAGNATKLMVTYYVHYNYSGFLPPLKNGDKFFKQGSTVPVKFKLTDAAGNAVSKVTARLYLSKMDGDNPGGEIEAVSISQAKEGNLFRYDSADNQYIFNLSTKTLSVGTWRLNIVLDDGTSKYSTITLK